VARPAIRPFAVCTAQGKAAGARDGIGGGEPDCSRRAAPVLGNAALARRHRNVRGDPFAFIPRCSAGCGCTGPPRARRGRLDGGSCRRVHRP